MSSYDYTMVGDGASPVALSSLDRIAALLDSDLVGWFTTVSPEGAPQSSAVWFLREGDTLLMYSSDGATRLRNLAANDAVAFNLRGDRGGDDIVTMEGAAAVDADAPAAAGNADYLEKYAGEIARLGWTPESFAAYFPVPVRITIRRVRAWKPAG